MKSPKWVVGMVLCGLTAGLLAFVFWNAPEWYNEWLLRQQRPEPSVSTGELTQQEDEPAEPETAEPEPEAQQPAEEEGPSEEELEAARIEAEQRERFADLLARNPDVVGWITIDGTDVDLPLMQTTDNDFYLHHDLDGNYDNAGLPFVDYECDIRDGRHLIIYGHHMASRFNDLAEYYDPDYYVEHPVIQLDTLYESTLYKVVAVYAVTARTEDADYFPFNTYVDFDTDAEEQIYLDEIEQRAFYTTGDYVRADERLLSLCTCTYQMADARLIVMARPLREGESAEADEVTVNPAPLTPARWP